MWVRRQVFCLVVAGALVACTSKGEMQCEIASDTVCATSGDRCGYFLFEFPFQCLCPAAGSPWFCCPRTVTDPYPTVIPDGGELCCGPDWRGDNNATILLGHCR